MINRFRGAVLGTAIGDALGAPMETMWAKDIAEKFPHFSINGIDFVSSLTDDSRSSGKWTDDTQLMIPTAWSIIFNHKINLPDIANSYVNVYNTQIRRGWGRSTTEAIARLVDGCHWTKSAEGSVGTGNGPAMKAAPLGLYLYDAFIKKDVEHIRQTLLDIIDVGRITHTKEGIRSGLLQSALIALAAQETKPDDLIKELELCEMKMFTDKTFSTKVASLLSKSSIADICESGGVTSKAIDSWCSTAAVFINHCYQKSQCMPALVELIQQGGDTDTTGAMLGALIGAKYGDTVFPRRLRHRVEGGDIISRMGEYLFKSMNFGHPNYQPFSFRAL